MRPFLVLSIPLLQGDFCSMAKSRTDTESVLKLVIDGKQANNSVKELGDTYRKLNAEINNMKKSDNPAAYAEKVRNVQAVERAWREAREEIRGAGKETASFKSQMEDLAKSAVGNLSLAGGVFAVVNGVKTMISKNAELSDVMAGVMKTTGLSEEAVDRLNEKFKQMDTRTANAQLLELAQVAGKLGYSAEKDVMGFVAAADKIGVALGEDLGGVEEAVNSLGKLVNIFKINDQFELEDSLLKVGSAINTLGASGTANEKNLIDFAQRLAGVAPAANISLPQVLALGAVMDELGQRMETSSTAIGQFLVQIGSDVPKYAKIAGMSVKDFSALLQKDANEAFLRVISGAKSTTGGIEGLAKSMGVLEVSGSGGIAALGAIADNVDLVRDRLKIANEAFDEGTSVLDEFNTVNTNLAANLEKIWNKIGQFWESSAFRDWLTDITGALLDNRSEFEKLTTEYHENKKQLDELESALNGPIERYDELTKKTVLNNDEQAELQRLIQQLAKEWPIAVTELDQYGNALSINTEILKKNINEQKNYLRYINSTAIAEGRAEKERQERYKAQLQHEIQTKKVRESSAYGGNPFERNLSNEELKQKYIELEHVNGSISAINYSLGLMGEEGEKAYDTSAMQKHSQSIMADEKAIQSRIAELNKEIKSGKLSAQAFKEKTTAVEILTDKLKKLNSVEESSGTITSGGKDESKAKNKKAEQAKREQDRLEKQAKEHFERLLKEENLFSANQLINQKAKHEKEVAQVELSYQKQIDKWQEFKEKKGATSAQLAEADAKIGKLNAEREKAVQDLRLRQETELLQSIGYLRSELVNKHQTELDKERDRIKAHYDKLKEEYRGNAIAEDQIEAGRARDLADAKIRAEQSLHEEVKRMRDENALIGMTDDQKKLTQLDMQYTAELEKLREKYNSELQETELFQEAIAALDEEYALKREEIAKAREEKKKEDLLNAAIDTAQNIANATFSIISNNIQAESNARLSEIEKQRDRELSNKNLTEKQKKAIQDKYDKQISAEKLRAWKAQKKADILSATINTALAVTKALPNWILAAAAGAAGAAQIAVIAAQKAPHFERGGFIPKGSSHSQGGINLIDSRTRNFVGQIEGGEPILSRKTYANNRDIVDALLYTSQRQNGARIQLRPDLIEAEQSARVPNITVGSPVVNVDSPAMDNTEIIRAIRQLANKASEPQKVILSTRVLEDYNDKKVEIENKVNG